MKRFALIIFIVLCCAEARAQLAETGAYPFRIETAARPLGMGAAFTGLADDVNTIIYNPGGMAWAKGIALTLRDFDNLAAVQAYPTGYGSSLGLAVITSKLTDLTVTPSGTATSNSSVLVLSFGTKLNFLPVLYKNPEFQRVGIGFNIKTLMGETFRRTGQPDRSATGWDMDLGLLWKRTDWMSIGVSAQNILPKKTWGGGFIKWDNGSEEVTPASLKIGVASKLIGDIGAPIFLEGRELILGGEIGFFNSAPALLRLGGEFILNKTFSLRSGLMQQHKGGSAVTTLNFGAGMRSEEWGVDLVAYHDALRDQMVTYISLLYFPREWIVVRKLDVERPGVVLEKAIEKISLSDNIVTYDDKLEIYGVVKPGVEVYVNGLRAYTAADNSFKVVIPLDKGKNLVLVEARYEGEKKTWKYKVLRKAKVTVAEEKQLKRELERPLTAEEKEALKKQEQEIGRRKDKVEELVTLGVIEVTPEAEFKLNASVTRGELAAWIAKAAGLKLPKVDRDIFPDVRRDNPLAPYIKVAVDWNVLKPFPDGTFRPDAPVSKEEGERLFKVFGAIKR
jgi:hypothetical protein